MGDPHVVVLGGGLAGVAVAAELGRAKVSVTLIDRHDYSQFQPLLYQVATSQLPAEDIARPLRAVLAEHASVQVLTGEVTSVAATPPTVTLADGRDVGADYLVLAAGGRPDFFGIPGAQEHSFPLYSVADAELLRRHLRRRIDDAREGHGEPAGIDVAVVGAGPTGVETSGAVAELLQALHAAGETPARGKVHLVDRGDALLNGFSSKAHGYAQSKLSALDVEISLGHGVRAVHADGLELDDGSTIGAGTVVWAGGESAAAIVATLGLPTGRGGRLDTRPDLTLDGHPAVYAVGDAANIATTDGAVLPQLGSVAQQAGRWAAQNILRDIAGESTEPFRYKDKGIMAMIGRNAAVAEIGSHRHQVDGPLAFAAWLGVHATLLSGTHNRVDAFLNWAWDYFERDHPATVDSYGAPQRIAWRDADSDRPTLALDPEPDEPAPTEGAP